MKLYVEPENDELFCSFSFAKAFYEICKNSFVDVETVANMMLLEEKNQKESVMPNDKL